MALLTQKTACPPATMTLLNARRVWHLEHLDLISEGIGRLAVHLPRPRSRAVSRTVDLASRVRCERPRSLPLLSKRLNFILFFL